MKKTICAILCLSIVLTGIIGITAASAENLRFQVFPGTTSVTCRTQEAGRPRAGFYARVLVNAHGNFERGTGLSNEGQQYTEGKTTPTAWVFQQTIAPNRSSTAKVRNSRDFYVGGAGGWARIEYRRK